MEMSADTLDRSSQIARALNPSSVKLDERVVTGKTSS